MCYVVAKCNNLLILYTNKHTIMEEENKNKDNGLKNLLIPLLLFVGISIAAFLITTFIIKSF